MPEHVPSITVAEYITLLEQSWSPAPQLRGSKTPIISIISPFFNAHHYFEAAYQSIYHQTFQDFEWLIVDDASTAPEAIALLETLPQRASNIQVIRHTENQGPAAARNKAIAAAKGKYLFFFDPDDLIAPTYLEKGLLFLEAYPEFSMVNACGGGFQEQDYWWPYGFEQRSRFLEQNWITSMLLYRRTDFEQLGGFDETLRCYEDWEYWLRAITSGQQGWTIPEYLQFYRRTESGLLGTALRDTSTNQKALQTIRDRYCGYFVKSVSNPAERQVPRFSLQALRSTFDLPHRSSQATDQTRVLCLFSHLEMGGADRFNLDCITTLQQRGYKMTIATTLAAQNVWQHHFEQLTSDIFHLNLLLDNTYWLAALKHLIASRQIDLVLISNSYVAYYFLPLLRQTFPNVAFVDYTHAIDPDWRGKGYPRLSCQFTSLLDRQVVSSEDLAAAYRKMGAIAPDKLHVCYTGIDTQKWQPNPKQRQSSRNSLHLPDETVVLLYPARFVSQKRPLFLVDLVKSLVKSTLHPICVLVVGAGDLKEAMQQQIHLNNLTETVKILPPVAPAQMSDLYGAADILLLPSSYEGLSLTLYEAMAMALPVVASAVGGQAELVIPETGYLIPLGQGGATEIQAYLDVLVPLIANPQQRQQLGNCARQRVVKNFSLSTMAETMDQILQGAIAYRQHHQDVVMEEAIAEEILLMTLEYLHQEELCHKLWWQKNQLQNTQTAMKSSKFWKIRERWIKIKHSLGWITEEIV